MVNPSFVSLVKVSLTFSFEKEIVREFGIDSLPTYRALRSDGDSHSIAYETLRGEALHARFAVQRDQAALARNTSDTPSL